MRKCPIHPLEPTAHTLILSVHDHLGPVTKQILRLPLCTVCAQQFVDLKAPLKLPDLLQILDHHPLRKATR